MMKALADEAELNVDDPTWPRCQAQISEEACSADVGGAKLKALHLLAAMIDRIERLTITLTTKEN